MPSFVGLNPGIVAADSNRPAATSESLTKDAGGKILEGKIREMLKETQLWAPKRASTTSRDTEEAMRTSEPIVVFPGYCT